MKTGHKRAPLRTGQQIAAAAFKARCLELMDEVKTRRVSLVITKRGKAVARLVPVTPPPDLEFGCMRGTVRTIGDIVSPTGEAWNVEE